MNFCKLFHIQKRIVNISHSLRKKTTRFTFRIEYLENNSGFICHEIYPNYKDNIIKLQKKNN